MNNCKWCNKPKYAHYKDDYFGVYWFCNIFSSGYQNYFEELPDKYTFEAYWKTYGTVSYKV